MTHYIYAMEKLEELSVSERWLNFSIGENRWALMNNYIEEQIPRAGELSAKLLDRFNFAKMIEKRISLVSILRIFPKWILTLLLRSKVAGRIESFIRWQAGDDDEPPIIEIDDDDDE